MPGLKDHAGILIYCCRNLWIAQFANTSKTPLLKDFYRTRIKESYLGTQSCAVFSDIWKHSLDSLYEIALIFLGIYSTVCSGDYQVACCLWIESNPNYNPFTSIRYKKIHGLSVPLWRIPMICMLWKVLKTHRSYYMDPAAITVHV